MTIDAVGKIILELRADTAVAAIVGTKVWGQEIPDNIDADPRPFILVHNLVNVPHSREPLQNSRVSIMAVGLTPRLAAALYVAVSNALHDKGPRHTAGGTAIYRSHEEAGGQPMTDPQTGWPSSTAIYVLQAASIPLP
jgi:hypothetical protein